MTASKAAAQSSTRYATWCRPSPRLARKRATGESSRVGVSSWTSGVGDGDERLLDAVGLDDLSVHDLCAEGLAVPLDGRLEVADRDGDVVDSVRPGALTRTPRGDGRSRAAPRRRLRAGPGQGREPLSRRDAQHRERPRPQALRCTRHAASAYLLEREAPEMGGTTRASQTSWFGRLSSK